MQRASNNLVPLPYNRVSVQKVGFALDRGAIKSFLSGKEAYYQTDYVMLRNEDQCAVAVIVKEQRDGLFCRISDVGVLSLPASTHWMDDPNVDVGIPSALAEKARASGVSSSDTLVVAGLYEHVNFIHRPRPVVIDVFDLVPPDPPRLLDMARRVLGYTDFATVVLNARIRSITELLPDLEGRAVLFPCGVSQLRSIPRAFYLDERPERRDWVLVGCERSMAIHRHFYGDEPPRIELCPRKLFTSGANLAVMRCCHLENRFEMSGRVAVVPWGVDPLIMEAALRALTSVAQLRAASPSSHHPTGPPPPAGSWE